jgi:hypothetical protein
MELRRSASGRRPYAIAADRQLRARAGDTSRRAAHGASESRAGGRIAEIDLRTVRQRVLTALAVLAFAAGSITVLEFAMLHVHDQIFADP